MNSEGILKSDEYMTILVKFPKGTYSTKNSVANKFAHYYEMAEQGKETSSQDKTDIIIVIIIFLVSLIPLSAICIYKKLYLELLKTELGGYTYSDLIFIRAISESAATSITVARANGYSSGGGEYSSGGGGMGAFGGGSGGGGFR